jgi:hypothetical protein
MRIIILNIIKYTVGLPFLVAATILLLFGAFIIAMIFSDLREANEIFREAGNPWHPIRRPR